MVYECCFEMFIFSVLGKILYFFLLLVLSDFSVALLAVVIPVNRNFKNKINGVTCYLSSDGIHTDFILPTTNQFFDWRKLLDINDYQNKIPEDSYLGLGWGDRGFYLDIPTWNDLTFKVAARAMLLPTESLMHVIAHDSVPTDKKKLIELNLSSDEYLRLCAFISGYFKLTEEGELMHLNGKGYTPNDNFYMANQKYHALNTCNYWINKGLITTGVRTSIWSPVDWGLFFQLRRI